MIAGVVGLTVWIVTAPIVWLLSTVISSVPAESTFIVHEAFVWKSGWNDKDWIMNFVVQKINDLTILK